jgi:competence protein ComEC
MPSLGLFTNLTAMPIVSAVVMPFAVLGSLAMPFGLDGPFFHVMGLGLSATIAIARWFSERSPADIVGLIPPAAVAVLTIALLIATICSTWLRVVAIPVALVGLLLLIDRPQPDLFVSEDGRLVGLDVGDGRIAVNRPRPNEFTIENWRRAVRADEIVRPEGKQERKQPVADNGNAALPSTKPINDSEDAAKQVRGSVDAEELDHAPSDVSRDNQSRQGVGKPRSSGFTCAEGLCLARHPSGAVVAHALDAEAALDACATASVIVIDDASAKNVCRWKDVLVVTKRDLALNGSAAIALSRDTMHVSTVDYAISRPLRPWHDQRRFSREARGLPAYRRPDKPAKPDETSPVSPPQASNAASPSEAADQPLPDPAQ